MKPLPDLHHTRTRKRSQQSFIRCISGEQQNQIAPKKFILPRCIGGATDRMSIKRAGATGKARGYVAYVI